MSKILNVAMFITGAALGSVVTWRVLKKRYESITQEEIDSVKEAFKNAESESLRTIQEIGLPSMKGISDAVKESTDAFQKAGDAAQKLGSTVNDYAKELINQRYGGKELNENAEERTTFPRIITPDEYGEYSDYDTVSLTYFADGILADDYGHIMHTDEVIGEEALEHFGEYEDDCVFVRNNEYETDYEVVLDHREYSEVYEKNK